ncbi:MAG: HEAT repeat domain-containing protein [Planctomycetota bacterium]
MRSLLACGALAALLAAPALAAEKPKIINAVCFQPAVTGFKVTCDRWPDCTDLRQFGLDAVRIEGAKTNEEKALAVWRWMRRCTMRTNGQSPHEGGRWVDASKILNVYGAHHCGGLSLLLADIWRSTGYPARRLYRHGHTLGDLWYEDTDGVGRYHTFDNNYGWFVYTRDGSRIAHAEEIGADFSLYDLPSRTHVPWIDKKCWCWGWCHMWQMALPDPRPMNLHPGESVTRLWGNIGKPHHDNVGLRPWDEKDQPPYKREFGNGTFQWAVDFGPDWKDALAAEPVNATVKNSALVQTDPAKPAEVIYRVWLPYIIAEGSVQLNATGAVTVEADRGKDWRRVKPGVSYTEQGLTKKNGGPPGRYSYLLRVRLADRAKATDLAVRNIVQLNPRSLPTLLAGENRITVHGKLAEGHAVRVSYVWDDVDGKNREHEVLAASLPFTYTIRTAGEDWNDVVCRRITTAVVPDDGKGSRVVKGVAAPSVVPDGPLPSADVRTIIGPNKPPELKATDAYIEDLASEDPDVRRLAAAGLTIKRDPKAWDALLKMATEDVTQAKLHAIQALFWTDRERAAPFLRKVLTRDDSIRFARKDTKFGAGTNANCVGTIAAMCGLTGFKELVPELNERAWKNTTNGRWAVVRALGRLNDPRGYPAIRRFSRSGNLDTATISCKAAGRVKDPEAIKNASRWLRSRRYPIRTLNAIEAIGRAGVTGHTDVILEQLERRSYSEDWRARCAAALARVGEPGKCIGPLEKLLEDEKWPWVRERLEAALAKLRERAKAEPAN